MQSTSNKVTSTSDEVSSTSNKVLVFVRLQLFFTSAALVKFLYLKKNSLLFQKSLPFKNSLQFKLSDFNQAFLIIQRFISTFHLDRQQSFLNCFKTQLKSNFTRKLFTKSVLISLCVLGSLEFKLFCFYTTLRRNASNIINSFSSMLTSRIYKMVVLSLFQLCSYSPFFFEVSANLVSMSRKFIASSFCVKQMLINDQSERAGKIGVYTQTAEEKKTNS